MALSQELKEIYSNYERTDIVYEAIELSHPNFNIAGELYPRDNLYPADNQYPDGVPYGTSLFLIRSDENKEFNVDGNKTLFLAYPFGIIPPRVGDDNQDSQVVFDNVSRHTVEAIELASSMPEVPIKMRYFVFIDGEMDSQITPFEYTLTNVTVNMNVVQATGTRADLFKYLFPVQMYDTRFRGLMQ